MQHKSRGQSVEGRGGGVDGVPKESHAYDGAGQDGVSRRDAPAGYDGERADIRVEEQSESTEQPFDVRHDGV